MKKMRSLFMAFAVLLVGCASTSNVGYVPNRVEKNMLLPDGAKGDVLFSQKWSGELGKYANDKTQWQGKDSVLNKVKTETELGYGSVWHNEGESEAVNTLCAIMEDSGFKYGVAYVNYGNRIRRYVLMYKKNKLKNTFMDFFDPSHEFYVAYNKKESERIEKNKKKVESITEAILSPLAPSSSSSNETPEQTLYRLRHKTYDITRVGLRHTEVFQYRYIYYDNGKQVFGYIVDLDGYIRDEITYSIPAKYSISKEIRDLALKSLE